jgi:hypothetical protein
VGATAAYWRYSEIGVVLMRVPFDGSMPEQLSNDCGAPFVLAGGFFYCANGLALHAIPEAGGATEVLVTGEASILSVAVDETHVYWLDADNIPPANTSELLAVRRLPIDGSGAPELLWSQEAAINAAPRQLAIDDAAVYWFDGGGALRRIPKTGGTDTTLGSSLWPIGIAVDDTDVYFVGLTKTGGELVRVPKQ